MKTLNIRMKMLKFNNLIGWSAHNLLLRIDGKTNNNHFLAALEKRESQSFSN